LIYRRVEVTRDYDKKIPQVQVDPEQMKQVFLNLLLNGIEAVSKEGKIKISTHYDFVRKMLNIRFEDNGMGISAEELEKIWDPFYTTKKEGSGLGLSVAHRLVESQGGKIEVESKVGKGSIFTVILPIRCAKIR